MIAPLLSSDVDTSLLLILVSLMLVAQKAQAKSSSMGGTRISRFLVTELYPSTALVVNNKSRG